MVMSQSKREMACAYSSSSSSSSDFCGSISDGEQGAGGGLTYGSVSRLLLLVPLLVGGSLGLVWDLLLVVQGLPPLAQKLADLAYELSASFSMTITQYCTYQT